MIKQYHDYIYIVISKYIKHKSKYRIVYWLTAYMKVLQINKEICNYIFF